MLADIAARLALPQVQRRFVDGASGGAPVNDLYGLAGLTLVLAILVQTLLVAADYVATDIAQVGTNRLRVDLLDHVLRLDLGFHNTHTPGELIERIDGDVDLLGNFLSRFTLEIVGSSLLLFGTLALLFAVDWRIGATLLAFSVLAIVVLTAVFGMATTRWAADRAAVAELFGFLEERLTGTEDIRASGAKAYVMRRYFEKARQVARRRLVASFFGASSFSISVLLLSVATAAGLAMGALLYREGAITIGTVFLILSYSAMVDGPINRIARQVQDLQATGAAIGRVGQLLTTPRRIHDPARDGAQGSGHEDVTTPTEAMIRPNAMTRDRTEPHVAPPTVSTGPLSIAFDDVSFAYGDGDAVLLHVSLTVPAGTSLGLLGRTGSGKTTLTRLVFRLVDPSAGRVCLNGTDLRELRLAELRRRVALVTQDVQLFHATVRDNLTFFDRELPDERVLDAVEAVDMSAWLARQPAGLDTVLAPGGSGLSAGQAQLLALARVFLRDPGLVVLDEASSRLDPATEAQLERALGRLLAGRTVIVVAHRLATVRRVDSVAILADGRLVESGARATLAADPHSRFSRLLRSGEELLDEASVVAEAPRASALWPVTDPREPA